MRRALTLGVVVLALILGACGDDDTSTVGATTSTQPSGLGADETEDETTEGGAGADATAPGAECDALARAAAPAQAADSFPDNPHNTWAVVSTSVDEAGRAVVEVVPNPDDVGYPRFRFVSRCDGDDVALLGAYALDGGSWILLFTTNEPGASELVPEG